jgi:hypothetical protein
VAEAPPRSASDVKATHETSTRVSSVVPTREGAPGATGSPSTRAPSELAGERVPHPLRF